MLPAEDGPLPENQGSSHILRVTRSENLKFLHIKKYGPSATTTIKELNVQK